MKKQNKTTTHRVLSTTIKIVQRLFSRASLTPLKQLPGKALLALITAIIIAVALASCAKIWEEERTEVRPLPTTNLPTHPAPWEPEPTTDTNLNGE